MTSRSAFDENCLYSRNRRTMLQGSNYGCMTLKASFFLVSHCSLCC